MNEDSPTKKILDEIKLLRDELNEITADDLQPIKQDISEIKKMQTEIQLIKDDITKFKEETNYKINSLETKYNTINKKKDEILVLFSSFQSKINDSLTSTITNIMATTEVSDKNVTTVKSGAPASNTRSQKSTALEPIDANLKKATAKTTKIPQQND